MRYYEIYNAKTIKPALQKIKMKSALEYWESDELPVAKLTWVYGPKKPRDQIRQSELPVEDVSLKILKDKGLITLLDSVSVNTVSDVTKLSEEADAYIIGDMEDLLTSEEVLQAIADKGKPLISEWDNWGYSIHGRLSKYRFNRFSNVKYLIPMGSTDVKNIIKALRALSFLRHLRIIYIGNYPPRSVGVPAMVTLDSIQEKFGVKIYRIGLDEYVKTVNKAPTEEAEKIAGEWITKYSVDEHLKSSLVEYAKIYIGLKKLLEEYSANAVTIECPALPHIKYVPCVAFSHLLEEGIPAGCEADIPALLTLSILMGASGDAAFMGNLNENVTHWDIEHNIITVNHDIVPPSYSCPRCRYFIKDYHNMKMGATTYTELQKGQKVTLAGMHWNLDKIWATSGEVVETYDTIHCRITVAVKVNNAKKISREAFGHHIAIIRGDYVDVLRLVAYILGLEYIEF